MPLRPSALLLLLAAALGVIFCRRLRGLGTLLAVALGYCLLWYLLRQNVRFLFPVVPLLGVVTVWVWIEVRRFPAYARPIVAATFAVIVVAMAVVPLDRSRAQLAVAVGWEDRADYLFRHEPTYTSATLANKALEVIEAHFLYGIDYDSLGVVVHPQSIVHSFVEFVDGSVLAQLGFPTMELPILYALSYPERIEDPELQTFDPVQASPLVFEEVDGETFRMFSLGERAGREGGTSPAVYNAANEIGVDAFLKERVRFPEMGEERAAFDEEVAKRSIEENGFYRFHSKTFDPVAEPPRSMP